MVFAYKYDGKEYPATGLAFDVLSVKRTDANTTTFDVKKTGGKYDVTGQNVISAHGKMTTQTAKGTDADTYQVSAHNSAPLFARKRVPTRIGVVPARPGGVTEPPASPIF